MSTAPCSRGRFPARDRSWTRRREGSFWKTSNRGRGLYPLSEGRVPVRPLGLSVSEATVCREVGRLSHSRKRSRAAERDEFLRLIWRTEMGRVDPGHLVFLR